MQPASFRGVAFHVPEWTLGTGRLGPDHEFVGSDSAYAEDTGGEAERGTFTATVFGDDWVERATDLRDALREEGPGVLVHPFLGRRTVQIRHVDITQRITDEGPVVRFAINYTETGDQQWPLVIDDTEEQARTQSAAAKARAIAAFASTFDVEDVPGWSRAKSITKVGTLAAAITTGTVTSTTALLSSAVDTLENDASTLVDTPADLAAAFQSAIDQITTIAGCDSLTADAGADDTSSVTSTPNTDVADANDTAMDRLVRRLTLARVVELAADTTWDVADDAIEVRNTYAARIYAEADKSDSTTREELIDLASAFVLDIDARVGNLARLETLVLDVPFETALTLAWDLYGDAGRALEIVERNGIRHPLFVDGGELVVASS